MVSNIKKPLLEDVCYGRLMLVVLLVLYHAFAIHTGNWEPLGGVIYAYSWVGKVSYAFMLEAFVFISGYVYGYQIRTKGLPPSLKKELIRKAKRLLLPALVFGIVYSILFDNIKKPFYLMIWNIIQGEAHLWFLPMLFWCFVFILVFEHFRWKAGYIIPLLLLIKICNFIPLPLRLWECFSYLPFFYISFFISRNEKMTSVLKKHSIFKILVLGVAFLIIFTSATLLLQDAGKQDSETVFSAISRNVIRNYLMLSYATIGIMLMFAIANKLVIIKRGVSDWVVKIGSWCFGIYIYQQFVLMFVYYHTPIDLLNHYLVPWVGFVIALIVSIFLAYLTLKIKIGKYLIG